MQLTCALERPGVPYAVSLVENACDVSTNVLQVLNTTLQPPDNQAYGVCTSPFIFEYDNLYQFVENVEVKRLFGASFFIFYNNSLGPDVARVVSTYVSEGLAEVVQWKLPVGNETIHYFGQIAAINDCLYRTSQRTKYVLFSDLDELPVPRLRSNWSELIETITQNGNIAQYGSFIFRNAIFRLLHTNTSFSLKDLDIASYRPSVVLENYRSKYVYPSRRRSKYIAVAKRIQLAGIHAVASHFDGYQEYTIPTDMALLNHYKPLPDEQNIRSLVKDSIMLKFQDTIIKRINDRFQLIKEATRTD